MNRDKWTAEQWEALLVSEGLGERAGRNGSREAMTVPYDDRRHAPVACRHGVMPYACASCTGTDQESIPTQAYRLAKGSV